MRGKRELLEGLRPRKAAADERVVWVVGGLERLGIVTEVRAAGREDAPYWCVFWGVDDDPPWVYETLASAIAAASRWVDERPPAPAPPRRRERMAGGAA